MSEWDAGFLVGCVVTALLLFGLFAGVIGLFERRDGQR